MVLLRGAGTTDEINSIQQNDRQRTILIREFIRGEQRMIPPAEQTTDVFVVFASG
jgi:hypothetical protein